MPIRVELYSRALYELLIADLWQNGRAQWLVICAACQAQVGQSVVRHAGLEAGHARSS